MSSTTVTRIRKVDLDTLKRVCDRKLWSKVTALRVAVEKLAAEVEDEGRGCVGVQAVAADEAETIPR